MATLKQVRDALRSTLQTNVPNLTIAPTVPEVVNLPGAVIVPQTGDYVVTFGRGMDTYEFRVSVLVSDAEKQLGPDTLDAYVSGSGALSIRAILFTNKTLGLAGTDAHVAGMSDYAARFAALPDLPHIAAVLRVIVHTDGT